MLETLGTSVVNVSAQWWDAPEYNEGELYLPSARSLSPAHQKILENIAAAAENKEIEIRLRRISPFDRYPKARRSRVSGCRSFSSLFSLFGLELM